MWAAKRDNIAKEFRALGDGYRTFHFAKSTPEGDQAVFAHTIKAP